MVLGTPHLHSNDSNLIPTPLSESLTLTMVFFADAKGGGGEKSTTGKLEVPQFPVTRKLGFDLAKTRLAKEPLGSVADFDTMGPESGH